jgi:rhodanese-related sulfurtransferase
MIRAVLLTVLLLTGIGCQKTNAQYREISVAEAETLLTQPNTYLLDVRTQGEHDEEHLEGAKLIPLSELKSRLSELEAEKGKELIVYCRTGSRSASASELLSQQGYKVANVEGGISAWQSAGKPVVTGSN